MTNIVHTAYTDALSVCYLVEMSKWFWWRKSGYVSGTQAKPPCATWLHEPTHMPTTGIKHKTKQWKPEFLPTGETGQL